MDRHHIKVWDPLVRIFHWSLVSCIAVSWFTADDIRTAHEVVGYAAMVLIATRVLWGFAGTRYARFSQFLRGPHSVWRYARQIAAGQAPRYIGHNPLGAWMAVALMLMVMAIGGTGWMLTLDAFFGNEGLESLHEGLAVALLLLAATHVAGALFTGWSHQENLVRSMFSGIKHPPQSGDVE